MITQEQDSSLTEIEALGLQSRHDLANGHASQELAPAQQAIIGRLDELWRRSAALRPRQAEWMFQEAFRILARTPSLSEYKHFKICPTASNSIDTAATWLAAKGFKTALIEPTFDNLYLILKRRGVPLTPLPENVLHAPGLENALKDTKADAVFLVHPNNPTGHILSKARFEAIVDWCAENGKTLVLDNTFRFFEPPLFDPYEILIDSGVTFLSIEDTGKVWPTQELKASLLFCSPDIIEELAVIYDEIFLCASSFTLLLLAEFLKDAHTRGLSEAVWKELDSRRTLFRDALDGTSLMIHPESLKSRISVEWVRIGGRFQSDLELAEHFKALKLVLLPGRQFFWSKKGADAVPHFARFALLKPKKEFLESIQVLSDELRSERP